MWALPWADKHFGAELDSVRRDFPDDIIIAPSIYNPSQLVKGDPFAIGSYIDEWGCEFTNIHDGVIGEVKTPAINDALDLSNLHTPYELIPKDKAKARDQVNRFCDDSDKFILAACLPRPWERLQFLRGTVNAMMDVMMPENGAGDLIKRIHDFYMTELEFWCSTDIDGIFFMDDWGSQTNLLIPPNVWKELFKPLYKDYCDIAHANDKLAFMHSDGNITSIYPELVDAGVDAQNSQLFCMDMEEIAKSVKGKIAFWGEIDRQHILPSEDESQVRAAVRKVAKHLYDPSGGIIAQFEIGPGAIGENARIIFEEWEKVSRKD